IPRPRGCYRLANHACTTRRARPVLLRESGRRPARTAQAVLRGVTPAFFSIQLRTTWSSFQCTVGAVVARHLGRAPGHYARHGAKVLPGARDCKLVWQIVAGV